MQLEDWLDDLCVRFIINLPPEELESVERICFQVEEAQWFYEDFIRPLDPSLPSLPLRAFSLRIFQHCPLFSQWSAEHYTTAFAEFMAYKSRVPVRGAIMLNEAMDECVLVKGWKKGANWSFPRGKINKDENDLDCAVREVYEETGFDLRAAGLVREEKDMKYIEQTMREQHMKLFVFRGVPKETHFEPRTRKEISKIEWYKLTDLPTLKKHKHQDSNGGEHVAMNANKFYMVAPFLSQLKKWIAQQRKKDTRHSSNLAAPPLLAEESEAENVLDHGAQLDQIPSDLPEVTISRSDATAHLKELFNIGTAQQTQTHTQRQPPTHIPQFDAAKSNALLALLRGGPSVELRAGRHTPLEQVSYPPDIPQSPHRSHIRSPPSTHLPSPPRFNVQSELPSAHPPPNDLAQQLPIISQQSSFGGSLLSRNAPIQVSQTFDSMGPSRAPYQQTGDPEFARPRPSSQQQPRVPPASALPKLTNHTKSLLDVFRGVTPASQAGASPQPTSAKQSLLDLFKQPAPGSNTAPDPFPVTRQPPGTESLQVSPPTSRGPEKATLPAVATTVPPPTSAHQNTLLELFGRGPIAGAAPAKDSGKPAELAATPEHQYRAGEGRKEDVLLALLRQQNVEKSMHKQHAPVVKEGETAATLSGPLNQPNFEAIVRWHKDGTNGLGRSPLSTHRTLYDPNQPAPMKIMPRPETPRQGQGKSPRATRAKMAISSPKRNSKAAAKEQTKPFQPQILRRPQNTEGQNNPAPVDQASVTQAASTGVAPQSTSMSMSREGSSEKEKAGAERKLSQTEAHKQTLLSLFGGPSPATTKGTQTPSRVVSPLSASQLVSPKDEVPVSAIEPISTRSRMGSMVSVGSGVAATRPPMEKRQTAAENKAFLLGYLGRMAATQEG